MKKTVIIVFLLIAWCYAVLAQRSELGAFGGVAYYHGELNPSQPFLLSKPAFGVVYRYNLHTRLAVKSSLIHGTLHGIGPNASIPTLYTNPGFNTRINELSGQIEFNYFNYFTGSKKTYISPYIFSGISLYVYDTTQNLRSIDPGAAERFLHDAGLGKNSEIAIALPFGVGVKYSLTRIVGLSLEWGMRKTVNDLLDGLNSAGTDQQTTNSKDNDWYSFAGLIVTVKLNANKRANCRETHNVRF